MRPFQLAVDRRFHSLTPWRFQTELLEIKKRDKVLEVGTGSGYQACVLGGVGSEGFFHRTAKETPLSYQGVYRKYWVSGAYILW